MSEIKNIIFDLGGVIINLEIQKTIDAFNKLSGVPFETIYTQLQQSNLFDLFDKGLISENDFFVELANTIQTKASKDQLITAWNAMLLDFPIHRLNLLKKLSSSYQLFLLSNTNETHIIEFESTLFKQHGLHNLDSLFKKVYYSCRIKMRKPDVEIFNMVLMKNNLNPNETMFIDDSPQHVQGALKTGIHAHLLQKNKDISLLINDFNL